MSKCMPHKARGRYKSYELTDPDGYYEYRRLAAIGDQLFNRTIHDVIDQYPDLVTNSNLHYNEFMNMAQSNKVLATFEVPPFVATFFLGEPDLTKSNDCGIRADVVEYHAALIEQIDGLEAVIKYYHQNIKNWIKMMNRSRKMTREEFDSKCLFTHKKIILPDNSRVDKTLFMVNGQLDSGQVHLFLNKIYEKNYANTEK